MTHREAYDELDKDRDNVARWFDHRQQELRRRAMKTRKFPVTWWLDYTSPRKNRYMICVKCTRRNYDRFHALTIVALRREERGYSVYLNHIGEFSNIRKTVFLQHVFDRYADPERGNVQKTGLDLIRHFIERQEDGITIEDHRLAGRSVRYNGRDHKFLAIDCGVLLGDIEDGVFIARTFITYEMATGKQHEAFSYAKNRLLNTEDMIVYVRNNSLYNQNKLIEFSNNL
jgi:hypothetical protein